MEAVDGCDTDGLVSSKSLSVSGSGCGGGFIGWGVGGCLGGYGTLTGTLTGGTPPISPPVFVHIVEILSNLDPLKRRFG